MEYADLIYKAKQELKAVADNPYQESLWILSAILKRSSTEIYLKRQKIRPEEEKHFWNQIQRRKRGAPLEHILQEKIFFNNKFYVGPGVFIPRKETELLAEWAVKNFSKSKEIKALDFGAGAGALCLSFLSVFPKSHFVAVELSAKSIEYLKKNSQALRVEKRLNILKKDVDHLQKEKIIEILGSAPSLIIANPPYIDPEDQSLSLSAGFFDPPLALFSDQGGMGHIISWFKKAMELLGPKGIYAFELGWNQLELVKRLLNQQTSISSYEIHKDQLGHPRMAVCFKR